jgi:hypothetical protein
MLASRTPIPQPLSNQCPSLETTVIDISVKVLFFATTAELYLLIPLYLHYE